MTLIEMMVIVAIVGGLYASLVYEAKNMQKTSDGESLGTTMLPYFEAVHNYVRKNRIALQNGSAIAGVANPNIPTVVELKALGDMPQNFANIIARPGGAPLYAVNRFGPTCPALPTSCDISYMVSTSQPYLDGQGIVAEGILASAVNKVGAYAGYTTFQAPATFTGKGGWTAPNPNGAVAGNFAIYTTYGASGEAQFLTMFETRDPQFQNNVTVNGNVIVPTGTVGTGIGTDAGGVACTRAEIFSSGAFWSRSATCIKRAWMDATGQVAVADAAGQTRGQLKDTGELVLRDATGNIKAGFIANGANIDAKADNVTTNSGTAGLRSNGETFGDSLVINTTAAVGGACPTNNASVWGTGPDSLVLLKCVANIWTATGIVKGAIGGSCPNNGQLGETAGKVSIICVNNTWQTTTSRIGSWAMSDIVYVGHGTVVTKPTCGSGSSAKIIAVPKALNATTVYQNFDVTDNGPSWTVSMWGASVGVDIACGTAIAQVGCWYP
jgi:type II secretory pathway pseudopilin PulG